MPTTTVAEFAAELNKSTDALLKQLNAAGVAKSNAQDTVSEGDKQKLLSYLQASHSASSTEHRKITLVKKSPGENLQADATGKARTIQVEVRKKRTFVTREPKPAQPTPTLASSLTSTSPTASPSVAVAKRIRIKSIQAKAFKAFRAFDFTLDGRHLLAYGGNGAGKSSLYWLLYTLLQSGQKKTEDVVKYFDPNNLKNLLNSHSDESNQAQAHITVTLEESGQTASSYTISANQHESKDVPDITKTNLASDFINYRVLFNFYSFRHSQPIDLWPVFENEILPFCYATGGGSNPLGAAWREINDEYEALKNTVRPKSSAIGKLEKLIDTFNDSLKEVLEIISIEAQKFYKEHFSQDDVKPISVLVGVTNTVSFDIRTQLFERPQIGFEVKSGDLKIDSPHTFLNEAKLTQLALSVRFGATLSQLRDAPLKLLVLDDLLVSLDMSNRMKVVDIILSKTFAEYQKIILTHDLGFFNEFRRRIGGSHTDWSFQHFKTTPQNGVGMQVVKDEIQKAEDYLHGQNLDEAASQLRKSADNAAKRWREWLEKKTLPPGEFFSLTENLNAAKNKLVQSLPLQLHSKILLGTPVDILEKLVPQGVEDLAGFAEMTPEMRGRITSKRKDLRSLLTATQWSAIENIRLIDDLLATTQRVLNPGAHGNEVPLYEAEVQKALDLIKQLKQLSESNANL